jgi:hypothetical protein
MNKISEFYTAVLAEADSKKEFYEILGDGKIENATEDQLKKIGLLAEKLGYNITLDEAKAYVSTDEIPLDDEELEAVAGGKNDRYEERIIICQIGGKAET